MSATNPKELQRIAKLLARAGIASRREIERMIAEGRVALNGQILDTPATLLPSLHGVTVDGNLVEAPAPARLFRYHKPSGLLTTERDPKGRPTIYDRLPRGLPRVMPVGRLDLATEGLLLLTTDGELKRELELPATGVERSYRARAYGQISQAQLEELMLGVEIEGIRYGSIDANIERRTGANLWIEMTLTEGKNREVRRVLEYLGLQVSRLIRTRYGPFHLGDLPPGDVDEIRKHDLITFRTVLSKPGGGKAASNLKFSTRARVPEERPAPAAAAAAPARGVRPVRGSAAGPTAARPGRVARKPGPPAEVPPKEARFTARTTPAAKKPTAVARPERGRPALAGNPARAARAKAHRDTLEPRPGDLVDRPRTPRPPRPGKTPAAPGPRAGGKPARPGKPPAKRPPRTRK